ncbi:ATP-dependent helicase [Rhodanobacter sp. B2A1Ga4]|uniref:ATP-dependent helicase n=1 Tax=Rhodanobacter sp. B2A1Ga4 TaxID=2778647 RepID=UPI001B370E6E|nr:ATP-dependent helicase [Rhodanobacter sp. B2A1Ga4]MBQ4855760.1 ATP-dependent helicase [Rhodanobacter sp. B2A1Ga4]
MIDTTKTARTLTAEQMAVVNHEGGHALVEAVPGSGKTTVLVARLRRLIRIGRDPTTILAVMFNKDAQLGFVARLRRVCGEKDLPEVRTFNSVGNAILKRLVSMGRLDAWQLKQGKNLERLARNSLKAAWLSVHGQGSQPSKEQFQEFLQFITLVKSSLSSAEEVWRAGTYAVACRPYVQAFANFLKEQDLQKIMFFDDQIYRPMVALTQDPDLWQYFENRYDEILIDELQDINDVCFFMMRGLAGSRGRVLGCGDPNQAIYSWRGSRVAIQTEEFANAFSPCKHFPLSYTFRLGRELALVANHLIVHNHERGRSMMIAADGNPETTVETIEVKAKQASGIVDLVTPRWKNGTLRDAAVLGRNFSHLVPYEIELAEAGIPYHVYGRVGLLFLPEVASLVCAVSLVADYWIIPPDERFTFLFSLLTTPTTFVENHVLERIAEAMEPATTGPARMGLHAIILEAAAQVRKSRSSAATNLEQRADAVRLLTSGALTDKPAGTIVQAYIRMTGMRETIQRSAATPEQANEMLGTLDAFVRLAERSGTARQFLDVLSPLVAQKEDKPPEGDHLRLTTLHRSKGLEWPLVAVVGLARGVFPDGNVDTLEEDRRLAYVGFTRAIKQLVLFHPEDSLLARLRTELDLVPRGHGNASPFLYEAELGLSRALHHAIKQEAPVSVPARRADVADRYLELAGATHVSVTLSAEAAAEAARRAAIKVSGASIPRGFRLAVGSQVMHRSYGLCRVVTEFHAPIYQVVNVDTGVPFSAVLDQENGWHLYGDAAQAMSGGVESQSQDTRREGSSLPSASGAR